MRLFVAIDLDERLRRAVADVLSRVRHGVDRAAPQAKVSWTDVDRMHVTVHFLGDMSDGGVPNVAAAFDRPLRAAPFELEIGAPGVFPSHGRPRVLWLGVSAKGGALTRVHDMIGERLRSAGLPIDPAPFNPHLTLGRLRTPVRPAAVLTAFEGAPRHVGACRVDAVTLYESRLGRTAAYVALASAALSGPASAGA